MQPIRFGGSGAESEDGFDEPEILEDSENSHSLFGVSPFTLGVFHANSPPFVCRYVIMMTERTSAVEAGRLVKKMCQLANQKLYSL